MDEEKLGKAIGAAICDAQTRMMPEMTASMAKSMIDAQPGVYVEVASAEMAAQLGRRASHFRTRAEEVAVAPPRDDLPSHALASSFARESFAREPVGESAASRAVAEAREQHVARLRHQEDKRKNQIEAYRTAAERLDFMAAHLPKDSVLRLDRRELDDLLFSDPVQHMIY